MTETKASNERERAFVARLDVGLDTMKRQWPEPIADRRRHGFTHQPGAGVPRIRVEPAVRVVKEAVDDLAEIDDAGDRRVITPAPDEGDEVGSRRACEEFAERRCICRRRTPRMMQRPAVLNHCQEVGFVIAMEQGKDDALTGDDRAASNCHLSIIAQRSH